MTRKSLRPHTRLLFCALSILALTNSMSGSTDFTVPPGRAAGPQFIVIGPDLNLWFTESTGESLGRVTTAGVVTQFPIGGAQSLIGIAAGPDGNIWFTDEFTGTIGHVNTEGSQLITYTLPPGSYPQGMTVGPDKHLWFVDQKADGYFEVGKISVSGTVTEYPVNINAGPVQFYNGSPAEITTGPDGNLWFTNLQASQYSGNFVGKITTAGVVTTYTTGDAPMAIVAGANNLWVTESSHVAKISTSGIETQYALKNGGSAGITVGANAQIWFTSSDGLATITNAGVVTNYAFPSFVLPSGLTSGPDGNLWFVGYLSSNIGKVATSGELLDTFSLDAGSAPTWDTLGPDGAIWFTEDYANEIGRIDVSGSVTSFAIPTPDSHPFGITTGPDGNLWFVEQNANQIAKITLSGTVTEYSLGSGFLGLWSITAGPDGNLWFTEYGASAIGRITTSGVVTDFPTPTPSSEPFFVITGPDGNLWFTEMHSSQIGKLNPGTGTTTEYSLGAAKSPGAITVGPDKNLWFLENTLSGAIGTVNTSGTLLAEYPVPFQANPEGLISGPDGALWLSQYYPNSVARVSIHGLVSEVALTATNAAGNCLALGSDGKLWVVDASAGAVSRLSAIAGSGDSFTVAAGTAYSGNAALYKDGTPTAQPSNFTALIRWGDGGASTGKVSGPEGGPFNVIGTHTYSKSGTYTVNVSLHDLVDNSTYNASAGTATVQ